MSGHQEYQEAREFNRLPMCKCDECIARRASVQAASKTAEQLSAEVRQQLRDGIMPVGFNNGLLMMPPETMPDPFFFQQSPEGLRPTIWFDSRFIGSRLNITFSFDGIPFVYEGTATMAEENYDGSEQ